MRNRCGDGCGRGVLVASTRYVSRCVRLASRAAALVASLCGSATLAQAETIPVNDDCKVALVAYMNGALQISLTGSTALTLTRCDIQLRAHGAGEDTAWSATQAASFALLGPGGTDQKKGKYCSYAVSLSQNTDVRFRAVNESTDDATDWITQENVRVEPYPLTPTDYTKNANYNPAGGLGIIRNGKQETIVELEPGSEWVQFDLGSTKHIAGLRVLPRLAFAARLESAAVQVADNAEMTGAQTVIASTPAPGAPIDATDWAFPSVVQGRYIRVTGGSKYVDFTEAEPYSDRPDVDRFGISAQQNAYNDAQPKISFTADWGGTESWTLERGFAATGPWDTVATGVTAVADLVDTVPQVTSAVYHYRAGFNCRTRTGAAVTLTAPVVAYRLARSLERDWTTDPSQLHSGVSILADCQMNSSYPTANAFDGNINGKFVATTANPLMGLDFGKACYLTLAMVRSRTSGYGINTPISLWGANVLPENTAAAQTADDPNHTELYRNTESGGGSNLGHWYRFPVAAPQAAYRYAFLHKNATDAAKDAWGNVLEITFYGYDADDAAAAQVIAPETFTAESKSTGIDLAWTHGYNIGVLEVERKAGDGEWTTIATPAASDISLLDPMSGLQQGTSYSYRLKAVQGDLVRYSSVATIHRYVPGAGTGLLATYSAPSPLASCDTNEVRLGSETVHGIDVTKSAGEAIYAATADNVLVAWKGKLIVPITGEYTFTADATDGFMLEFEGDTYLTSAVVSGSTDNTSTCSVINAWAPTSGAVMTYSVNRHLTAGEYAIRAWWNPTTGAKTCVLKWTLPGASAAEVIPVTQFLPASEPDPDTYGKDEWRFRTVSNARGYAVQGGEDAFAISEADTVNGKTHNHGSFLWRKFSSQDFILEACVYAPQMFNEYGGIFVSENLNNGFTGDGATLFLYRKARRDGVNVRHRVSGEAANEDLLESPMMVSAPERDPNNNNDWCWMRIVREGNRFTLKVRHGTVTAGDTREDCPWVTVATYDDSESRFGKDVYIGLASTTEKMSARIYQARYVFTNVKAKVIKGMTINLR